MWTLVLVSPQVPDLRIRLMIGLTSVLFSGLTPTQPIRPTLVPQLARIHSPALLWVPWGKEGKRETLGPSVAAFPKGRALASCVPTFRGQGQSDLS